ncbi:glutathione hydrolase 1 proenzyme-like [Amphibalanus amphitrite]|uniref:glutathione hydrolase 1 proenzyme-like n=1 Tax=Amphibalanus amphitrite TaxID=1232801 RepID=UPI001C9174BE|nr:glutathione hydrolase 1 proenzyme-like [Amphibalanus amphitrite]
MSLNSERFPLTSGLRNKNNENDGFKVIFVCFVVFSIAITVALIVQIHYGEPEIVPHAAVSSDHQTCSSIGSTLLRHGGSAVDAAVAATLCMTVVHPHTCGLAGGGFMLIHDHAHNQSSVVDFRESAPAGTDGAAAAARTGALSAAVPGLLRGLQLAHARHGRLAWSTLVQPSAQLARAGTAVSAQLAAALAAHLTAAEAQASPGLAPLVAGGQLLTAGQQLVQQRLADTLDLLQVHGADALYNGVLTSEVITALTSAGGVLTAEDLSGYQPLEVEGMLRDFGEYSVLTALAPSAGPALLAALELVSRLNITTSTPAAARYHRVTEALRLSMQRFALLGDPLSTPAVANDTAEMLSDAVLTELSRMVTDGSLVNDSVLPALDTPAATHVSVIDDDELYVSVVSGLGSYFGSKFSTAGGILFSNAMSAFFDPALTPEGTSNVPEGGRRPLATFSPAILMSPKVCGRRVVTGGSDATLLAQAVLRLTDPALNITTSLEAPRLHTAPDSVQLGLEADRPMRVPEPVLQQLRQLGHTTVDEPLPYPSCNAITKLYDQLSSHADSRGGGTAVRF